MFLILLLTFTKNQVSIGMQLLELGGERNWGLFFIQQLDCTFAFSKQRVQSKVLTLYSILQLTFTKSQVAEQTVARSDAPDMLSDTLLDVLKKYLSLADLNHYWQQRLWVFSEEMDSYRYCVFNPTSYLCPFMKYLSITTSECFQWPCLVKHRRSFGSVQSWLTVCCPSLIATPHSSWPRWYLMSRTTYNQTEGSLPSQYCSF